jgi:hypothetical protein
MTVFRLSEYGGFASGRPHATGIIDNPASGFIQTQSTTAFQAAGGVGSTFILSGATYQVMVDTDSGCQIFFGTSLSTSPSLTSTNTQRIPANIRPLAFYVRPGQKLFMGST